MRTGGYFVFRQHSSEFRISGVYVCVCVWEEAGVGPRLGESELQIWTQLKVYRAGVAGQAAGVRTVRGRIRN